MRRLLMMGIILLCVSAGGAGWANSHLYLVPPGAPATANLVHRSANELTVRIEVPDLQLGGYDAEGSTWDVLSVENLGVSSQVGAPLLPVWTRLIAVGPTEGVTVQVREGTVEIIGGLNLLPYQPAPYRDASAPGPFMIDDEIYAFDQWWPESATTLEEPVIIHGQRFVPVKYYPVRYNPVTGEIRYAHHATLQISGGAVDARNPLSRAIPPTAAFAPIINDISWSFARRDPMDHWVPADGAMVVIVFDDFLDGAAPYIEWKQLKGLPVEVWKTSEITGGGQDADAIRQKLYDRYHDEAQIPLDYIVIIGDYEQVTTLFGLYGCATDTKYAILDGNDYFPDAIVGRLSVKNLASLARVINKMVNYEKDPFLGDTVWFKKGLTISGSDSVDDQNAGFVADILENDAAFTKVDRFFQSNGGNTASNVTASLNDGRSWVTYFGHGSGTAWSSTNPPYTNQMVMNLTNSGKLPVITDISCNNGEFDASWDCFAEIWTRYSETNGAAGIFSASRSTPFGYTDQLGRGVAVGHFQQGLLTFGGACYYGKMYMYNAYPEPAGGQTEEVMQHYLVFGDPELNIWSDVPTAMTVGMPTTLEVGTSTPIAFTVTINETPLARALIHVYRDGEYDAIARTDDNGAATIDLGELTEGELNVFVTGRNALPFEASIPVSTPAADDDLFDDDSATDDDGADDDQADDDATDDDAADDDAADDDAADDDSGDDDNDDDSGGCGK